MAHRVWAEINLHHLRDNCQTLATRLGGADHLMLVCKADAYGHGMAQAVEAARMAGLKRLGVGDSREALEVRELGWTNQVLVLGSLVEDEVLSVIREDVALVVHSLDRVRTLDALTRHVDRRLEVHLKIDTGMRRFGTATDKAPELAELIRTAPGLDWGGVMTHFASPENPAAVRRQLDIFKSVLADLGPLDDSVRVHAASTRALRQVPEAALDFARCGLGSYGLDRVDQELKPVLSLHSQIIFLKDVPAEAEIGYEAQYVTTRPTRMAIFPMGYHDGLRLSFSKKGQVLVNGNTAPVIGRISMDYTTIDVTDIPDVNVGTPVTLVGADGGTQQHMSDIAKWMGTTIYEVPCLLGGRVHRVALR